MSAAYCNGCRVVVQVNGFLFLADRGNRFDSHPCNNDIAVRDAGQDAAGVVGLETCRGYDIVIFLTEHSGCCKTGADFHTLNCADRHKRLGQGGVQFIEDRFPESSQTAGRPYFNNTAK